MTAAEVIMATHGSKPDPKIIVAGQVPVAKRPEDRDPDEPRQAVTPAEVARSYHQDLRRTDPHRWRRVHLRAYQELGNAIAFLEAVERGTETLQGDSARDPENVEHLGLAEDLACMRGACLRVLDALEMSLEQARRFRPRKGQDLVLVAVQVAEREQGT